MKSFARHPVCVGLTVLLSVLLKTWAFASLEYELRQGLTLNWYFENADPAWPSTVEAGYFHDFNSDGLPDYLIHQSNNTKQDRIFCLDTSKADAPKTFADHTALGSLTGHPGLLFQMTST